MNYQGGQPRNEFCTVSTGSAFSLAGTGFAGYAIIVLVYHGNITCHRSIDRKGSPCVEAS
jgi:hypothetical protein